MIDTTVDHLFLSLIHTVNVMTTVVSKLLCFALASRNLIANAAVRASKHEGWGIASARESLEFTGGATGHVSTRVSIYSFFGFCVAMRYTPSRFRLNLMNPCVQSWSTPKTWRCFFCCEWCGGRVLIGLNPPVAAAPAASPTRSL